MKTVLIFVLLFIDVLCRAQPIMKDGAGIDTVTINGYESAYLWAKKGHASYWRLDSFQVVFDRNHNAFIISKYVCSESYHSDHKKKNKESIDRHGQMIGAEINRDILDSLMQSFSAGSIQPTPEQMGISESDLKAYLNEERIRKEIKRWTWSDFWTHHSEILTREKSPELFRACTSLDTLRAFMITIKIDTADTQTFTDDYADGIKIYINAGSYRYYYYSQPHDFKQPWHDEPQNAPIPGRKYTYLYRRTPVFNYAINKYLIAILPKDFVRVTQMRNEDLIDNYLTWFIKHQGFITQRQ